MPGHRLLYLSQIALLVCCSAAHASGPLFGTEDILDVELRGPLAETIRDKKKRGQRPFDLVVDGVEVSVRVRVRGNSRVRACRFPPLRLNFSNGDTTETIFAGQGKLKLVTHCKGSLSYEQNVLEEYAAYRIFAMLSDIAFRVRLLRIRYVDTGKPGEPPLVRFGFLIESEDEFAARVHGEVMHVPHVVKSLLKAEQAALVFVFQYLIGNTDWSLVTARTASHCCHNGALINISGLHHLVPYDFDSSGLVNARYAGVDPSVGILNVRSRRYRGYCMKGLQVHDAIEAVLRAEQGIRAMIEALPAADAKGTKDRLRYLQKVFDAARDGDELARRFEKRCIG